MLDLTIVIEHLLDVGQIQTGGAFKVNDLIGLIRRITRVIATKATDMNNRITTGPHHMQITLDVSVTLAYQQVGYIQYVTRGNGKTFHYVGNRASCCALIIKRPLEDIGTRATRVNISAASPGDNAATGA